MIQKVNYPLPGSLHSVKEVKYFSYLSKLNQKTMKNPFLRQYSFPCVSPLANSPRGFISPFISNCPPKKYSNEGQMSKYRREKLYDSLIDKMNKEYLQILPGKNSPKTECRESLIQPSQRSSKVIQCPSCLQISTPKSATQTTMQSLSSSSPRAGNVPYFISKRGKLSDITKTINPYNELKTKIKQAEQTISTLSISTNQNQKISQKEIIEPLKDSSIELQTKEIKEEKIEIPSQIRWNNKIFHLLNK